MRRKQGKFISILRLVMTVSNTHYMLVTVALMSLSAVIWLGYEFWRLLLQPSPLGAIDLMLRFTETKLWFSGQPIYGIERTSPYPPATYLLLWPFLGWLNSMHARWLWALTSVLALAWLIGLFLRESHAQTRLEKAFIILIPLATYGAGACIGNGQLIVHILPCLCASLLFLAKDRRRWQDDLLASSLFIAALVKPSVTAPFFWILLFRPGRMRPAVLVVCGYMGISLISGSFQESGIVVLMQDWLASSREELMHNAILWSHGNLHSLLAMFGLESWSPVSSLIVLTALGVWMFFNKKKDIWLLMGVTACVSRFYTYHGWYDDAVLTLPMVALFRMSKTDLLATKDRGDVKLLLAFSLAVMIAPGGTSLFPRPWSTVFVTVQSFIFLIILGFLLMHARKCEMGFGE